MSSITMLVQQVRWTERNTRYIEARAILDTKADMARQLIELLDNSMEDSRTWNDMGDEWRVDPTNVEACKWYEFTLNIRNKLIKMYPNICTPYWYDMNINIDDWDAVCELDNVGADVIKQMDRSEGSRLKGGWDKYHEGIEEVDAFWVIQAMHDLGFFKTYYENIKEYLAKTEPTTGYASFNTSTYGRQSYINSSIDVQVIRLPSDFFNIPSRIGEVNETLRDYATRKDDEEYARHVAHENTEEGKAEREAEAERERDLATFMGESGYTSFARNDDGTTTVWR